MEFIIPALCGLIGLVFGKTHQTYKKQIELEQQLKFVQQSLDTANTRLYELLEKATKNDHT